MTQPILFAQTKMDKQLALNYYNLGEYDKAVVYYEKIYPTDKSYVVFEQYFTSLMGVKDYKAAEKLVKKQRKVTPDELRLAINEAKALEAQGKNEKAIKAYDDAISSIDKSTKGQNIRKLATGFKREGNLKYVLKTYEHANKYAATSSMYNREIALVYGQQGKTELMISKLIDIVETDGRYFTSVQSALSNAIDFNEEPKKVQMVKTELIKRSQKNPNKVVFNELLAWVYMLRKNFNGAFIQYKAIGKKEKDEGRGVQNLGVTCLNNEAYEVAIKCFDYVIALGANKPFYREAKVMRVSTLKKKVISGGNFTQEELLDLKANYEESLDQIGRNAYSLSLIRELAQLEGYYLNNPSRGVVILEEAMKYPGLKNLQKAELKIELGDLMVIDDRIWDASLLFMQVEKDFKHDRVGHLGKFKAAQVFYYAGDFDWAQAQLDVLKASTSKLIANDAMELSMLITDNYNMDTTQVTMELFASAELLIKQHKYKEALASYDTISAMFTYHTLNDEILMKKYEIAMLQRDFTKAEGFLLEIEQKYAEDILADNAVYQLAELYDYKLGNKEKAVEYYKKIIFDYKGSLFGVEARKRYRELTPAGDGAKPIKTIDKS